MKLQVQAVCDVGKVRGNNEDIILVDKKVIRDASYTTDIEVGSDFVPFAVSDGLGGAEGGEIASELVITMFEEFVEGLSGDATTEQVIEQINSWAAVTNRLVLQRGEILGNHGMGTTLTAMITSDESTVLLNSGDSRVYRFRDGILRRMTTDHSLRELTGDPDTPDNLMYNAFGSTNYFFIDTFELSGFVFPDDVFLICSDGLSDFVKDDTIEEIMGGDKVVDNLLKSAYEAGGKDNVSIILIKIV